MIGLPIEVVAFVCACEIATASYDGVVKVYDDDIKVCEKACV